MGERRSEQRPRGTGGNCDKSKSAVGNRWPVRQKLWEMKMNAPFKNLIAGEWASAANASRNINPPNTDDVVGEYAQASIGDLQNAVAAAKAAFLAWSRTTPQERYDILKRASDEILARKDQLGRLLSREEGKTLAEGIGEVARAGQIFAFFGGECLRLGGETVPSVRP